MSNKSHPKNRKNTSSSPVSEADISEKEEHSALFSDFFLNNKLFEAFSIILGIIVSLIGNPLTGNYSLSSCLFCLTVIIIFILVCIIFMIYNKKAIKKIKKKIAKSNSPKKKHLRKKKNLLIWRAAVFCLTTFAVTFMSVPVLYTMCSAMQAKLQLISLVPTPAPAASGNDSSKGSGTLSTTPAPTINPDPTFTPVPYDESQTKFDSLWNTYFSNFCHEDYATIDEAISDAQNIVSSTWIHRKNESYETWPFEQMDIYGLSSGCYRTSLKYENTLRYHSSATILNNAGETYVTNTSSHIKTAEINGLNLSERDLGLGALRGIDLFAQYLSQNPESAQAGNIYDSMAILLRHCADNLYYEHETLSQEEHTKRFAFNTFSYVCYVQAKKHNCVLSQLDNDINEMRKSVENSF